MKLRGYFPTIKARDDGQSGFQISQHHRFRFPADSSRMECLRPNPTHSRSKAFVFRSISHQPSGRTISSPLEPVSEKGDIAGDRQKHLRSRSRITNFSPIQSSSSSFTSFNLQSTSVSLISPPVLSHISLLFSLFPAKSC